MGITRGRRNKKGRAMGGIVMFPLLIPKTGAD